MVDGFLELFKEKLSQIDLPITIKDVVLAADTHNAVSKGCLSEALLDTDEPDEVIEDTPEQEEEE